MGKLPKIHFNCILDAREEAPRGYFIRYLQVGYEDENGFTGFVQDYCGGGEYGDFYMLNGDTLDEEEVEENYSGEQEDFMEEAVPGLVKLISEKLKELRTFEEKENGAGYAFLPTEALLRMKPDNYEEGEIISDVETLNPVNGFNTTFDL